MIRNNVEWLSIAIKDYKRQLGYGDWTEIARGLRMKRVDRSEGGGKLVAYHIESYAEEDVFKADLYEGGDWFVVLSGMLHIGTQLFDPGDFAFLSATSKLRPAPVADSKHSVIETVLLVWWSGTTSPELDIVPNPAPAPVL